MAGLSTPLHLAASLLAFFAAVGLAVVALVRPASGPGGSAGDRVRDVAMVAGAGAIALARVLAGALVVGAAAAVAWLDAVGLALVAVGLAPSRLQRLPGPAVLVPIAGAPPATVVAALAGAAGALAAAAAGRRTLLVGVGLGAWGAAEVAAPQSATLGALLTVVGSAAIGWWLWHASSPALLAKFVTTSVVILLAVVVVIAGALSGLGSRDLVEQELDRLTGVSAGLATEISREWLRDASAAAAVLRRSDEVLDLGTGDRPTLKDLYRSFFRGQDQRFFAVVGRRERIHSAYAVGAPLSDAFFTAVAQAPAVSELVAGEVERAADLMTVDGTFVAVGGIPVQPRHAGRPVGAVLAGRIADEAWATDAGRRLGVGVVLISGGQAGTASPGVRPAAEAVAGALRSETQAGLTIDGRAVYAAAAPITDPRSGRVIGQAVAIGDAGAVAGLEQAQARRLFVLALLGALLAAAVAALVTRELIAPIRRLTAAAAAVREGNLDVDTAVAGDDEVGVLSRTFDEMTTSLARQGAQLRDAAAVQSRLRARLEALTASMSDALVAVDANGKVVTFNPAAERLIGLDVTEVLGLPLEQVLVGYAPGSVSPTAALGDAASEDAVAVQLMLRRHDGRFVPTATTAAPVRDWHSEDILGRVLVLRDVSREVEVERMKTEFLANVSHELRTPLTPIKGYAEVLASRDVPADDARHYAAQMLASASRLERIIAMIMDFVALESGRARLEPEPVALQDAVDDLLGDWRLRAPSREFREDVPPSLPPVCGDRAMLCRCIEELLDNAVKFSPGGEPITVSAELEATARRPARVRVSVRDQGVGIEPTIAARVFGDFYQADASETRHFGGLGLGLALVRRIIDGLGGEAGVESQPGEGSVFHLWLPVVEDSVAQTA